jgi:hypothetical protein
MVKILPQACVTIDEPAAEWSIGLPEAAHGHARAKRRGLSVEVGAGRNRVGGVAAAASVISCYPHAGNLIRIGGWQ